MDIESLKEASGYFIDNDDIGIVMYVITKEDQSAIPKKLDINHDDLPHLKALFINSIKENIINDEDLSVMPLSSSDERKNVIYEYDLDIPQGLAGMETVISTDALENFNYSEEDINQIKSLIIEIGDNVHQMVLYKNMSTVEVFAKKNFFLKRTNERFERIKEDFIRVTPKFQFFRLDDSLFVTDLKLLEKLFGFHDVIMREASVGVEAIDAISLLENPEVLHELIEDVTYARKLTKIAKSSPVLNSNIPNDKIIEFCNTHPALRGRIRFNDEENKIILDTQVSKKLFVQLLMDDYLTSELTELHYTSLAKDAVEEEG
tara:strand:- start:939 stop:1892 length:954 start_codon:yes stop_codon:yes gene_type:complete